MSCGLRCCITSKLATDVCRFLLGYIVTAKVRARVRTSRAIKVKVKVRGRGRGRGRDRVQVPVWVWVWFRLQFRNGVTIKVSDRARVYVSVRARVVRFRVGFLK